METLRLAQLSANLVAYKNCLADNDKKVHKQTGQLWQDRHWESIEKMLEVLPHGSGFDTGFKLNVDESSQHKIVFDFTYTHYTEGGYNDGHTEHQAIFTPAFNNSGYNLRITGIDKNGIKEYVMDTLYDYVEF